MKRLILFLFLFTACMLMYAGGADSADAGMSAQSVPVLAQTVAPAAEAAPDAEAVAPADEEPLHGWAKFTDSVYTNFVVNKRWKYLLDGFKVTMEVSAGATILGILIGFLVAVIRNTADRTRKFLVANFICKVYLTVIRGTPTVVQLMIIYYVIFASCPIDQVLVAIIAFGINSGAYVAEIVRSGIASIDRGQFEAASSLGLHYSQSMTQIILPQAFKNILPALGNEFIVLLKETSVSGYIALRDLTKGGDIIRSQTYEPFLPLFAVALIYLVVVMLFTWLLGILERKLKKNE